MRKQQEIFDTGLERICLFAAISMQIEKEEERRREEELQKERERLLLERKQKEEENRVLLQVKY